MCSLSNEVERYENLTERLKGAGIQMKKISIEDRKKIASIYNKNECCVNYTDVDDKEIGSCVLIKNDPIRDHFFKKVSEPVLGTKFYHYITQSDAKPYAMSVLVNKLIRLQCLESFKTNDDQEFKKFYEEVGAIHPFEKNRNGIKFIDEWKRHIYCFCVTDSPDNDVFWSKYGNVCFELSFKLGVPPACRYIVNFRNVSYDLDDEFHMIKNIQNALKTSLNLKMSPNGFGYAAMHYKRKQYNGMEYYKERETRLVLDYNSYDITINDKSVIENKLPVFMRAAENYIPIPWNSKFIKWEISKIFCSNKLEEKYFNAIHDAAKKFSSNIEVLRHNKY